LLLILFEPPAFRKQTPAVSGGRRGSFHRRTNHFFAA
jgi:hypothetical protein